jgi:hypothetical protein
MPAAAPSTSMELSETFETQEFRDISVCVEAGGDCNVLVVQIPHLREPRVLGIVGGENVQTDENGTARLLVPHKASVLELTISDHRGVQVPFLRLNVNDCNTCQQLNTDLAPATQMAAASLLGLLSHGHMPTVTEPGLDPMGQNGPTSMTAANTGHSLGMPTVMEHGRAPDGTMGMQSRTIPSPNVEMPDRFLSDAPLNNHEAGESPANAAAPNDFSFDDSIHTRDVPTGDAMETETLDALVANFTAGRSLAPVTLPIEELSHDSFAPASSNPQDSLDTMLTGAPANELMAAESPFEELKPASNKNAASSIKSMRFLVGAVVSASGAYLLEKRAKALSQTSVPAIDRRQKSKTRTG